MIRMAFGAGVNRLLITLRLILITTVFVVSILFVPLFLTTFVVASAAEGQQIEQQQHQQQRQLASVASHRLESVYHHQYHQQLQPGRPLHPESMRSGERHEVESIYEQDQRHFDDSFISYLDRPMSDDAPDDGSKDGGGGGDLDPAVARQAGCRYPCSCQKDPPRCKAGNTIKDGCNCCHVCPRQQGDLCDLKFRCDEDRGLYCELILDDGHRGICRAKSAKSCDVDGKTYKDGEEFKPNCSQLCTCQNGQYACASLCPQEERPPSRTHCRDAQLVSIVGQCCREWVCPHAHSLPQPDDVDTLPGAAGSNAERCIRESTGWSACSVTCGMGVSIRVTNDNKECQSQQERRLCLIRPCNLDDKQYRELAGVSSTGGANSECRSTWRDNNIHLKHGECTSVDTFRPKYCTMCKRNRCCGPGRSKNRPITFICPDGKRYNETFQWIQSCECKPTNSCPYTVIQDNNYGN